MQEKIKKSVFVVVGLIFGLLLLSAALKGSDSRSLAQFLSSVNPYILLVAVLTYLLNIMLRSYRWRLLLRRFRSWRYTDVLRGLFIGYAFNNVLPARLGELVRADFIGGRYNLSRSSIFGTIVIERLFDALLLLLMLMVAAAWFRTNTLVELLVTTIPVVAVLLVAVFHSEKVFSIVEVYLPDLLREKLGKFVLGLNSLKPRNLWFMLLLSAAVWMLESAASYFVLLALGVALQAHEVMLLVAIAAFSTLLPTAPAYIGSFQYAYVVAFSLFEYSREAAIAASLMTQMALMGSVTVIGLLWYIGTRVRCESPVNH